MRKLRKEHKSIYLLTAIEAEDASERVGDYKVDQSGNIMISQHKIGVFSSVEKAEETIKKLVKDREEINKKWNCWTPWFGFTLDELYLDDSLFRENNWSLFESSRSYLSDGTLNCFSDLDYRCKKRFQGREEPQRFIKDGDFALASSGDHLTLILLEKTAMTREQWKRSFKPGVFGDFTDDSGLAFSADGMHEHPLSVDVFPLSNLIGYQIPKKLKDKILKSRDKYYSDDVCS